MTMDLYASLTQNIIEVFFKLPGFCLSVFLYDNNLEKTIQLFL
jgi:hypothetical protein